MSEQSRDDAEQEREQEETALDVLEAVNAREVVERPGEERTDEVESPAADADAPAPPG